ncbi:MAG TPA: DNA translocase FtsK 4TM domain-containing protein [Chloroflexota bacterium]|nr:DNA translocase FtsK 4TM domain-containing protein [Chloroflexota bacterium]
MSNNRKGNGRTTTSAKPTRQKTTASSKPTRGGTQKPPASRKTATPRKTTTPRKATRRSKTARELRLNLAQKALIIGIVIVFLTVILVLSLLSPTQGQLTETLSMMTRQLFGWGGLLAPIITGGIGLYLVLWGMDQQPELPAFRVTGFVLLFLSFEAFATQVALGRGTYADVWAVAKAGQGGGYLGGIVTYGLQGSLGNLGAAFTLIVVAIIGAVLLSGVTRESFGHFINQLKEGLPAEETAPPEREVVVNSRRSRRPANTPDPNQPPLPLAAAPEQAMPAPDTPKVAPPRVQLRPSRETRPSTPKKEPAAKPEAPTIVSPVFLGSNGRPAHNWQLPTLTDMLNPGTDHDPSGTIIREQVEIIEHTLESFGAPATVVEINQGPTVTQFGVEPSFLEMRNGKRTKVKVGKIAGLADDLALALHAAAIRIQAPVPGKGYVGIEVPNPAKALVSLRDVMETTEFQKIKSPLRLGLGQDVAGQPITADLTKMPHLLIAGATGSGKSVCVNGIIACLLLQNTPDQLKLVMVDPKRVELTGYNGIPHLAAPVVVEMDRVIGVLQWAMREMDNRYKLFAEVGARNITDYNKKIRRQKDAEPLPYIVIIVDELADLMMMSPEETERGITRLAQLARATGMHLIIATQRPSVDVVTGLIKANFPARIAFAVASGTDSRVILDATGAERLLGQGDMLYQAPDAASPIRAQGCFVSDGELNKLIDYWRIARRFNLIPATESAQPRPVAPETDEDDEPVGKTAVTDTAVTQPAPPIGAPVINMGSAATRPAPESKPVVVKGTAVPLPPAPKPEPPKQQPLWEALQEIENEPATAEDELMPEAIAMVRQLNKASTSLLQRRFRIGYTRAARLIDQMEEMGIVGPPTGTSKAREVLPADGAPTPTEPQFEGSHDTEKASEDL